MQLQGWSRNLQPQSCLSLSGSTLQHAGLKNCSSYSLKDLSASGVAQTKNSWGSTRMFTKNSAEEARVKIKQGGGSALLMGLRAACTTQQPQHQIMCNFLETQFSSLFQVFRFFIILHYLQQCFSIKVRYKQKTLLN